VELHRYEGLLEDVLLTKGLLLRPSRNSLKRGCAVEHNPVFFAVLVQQRVAVSTHHSIT
jgi:hypothetical protein